jgi:hypothetical protein
MLQRLVKFKETHGHLNVPCTTSGLGPWIYHQRQEERKGFLNPLRAEKLNAIGFSWGKLCDEQWEDIFASLLAFTRKHGHCKGPFDNRQLGTWVSLQRHRHKKGTLKPEREARLISVGFAWSNDESRNNAIVEERGSRDSREEEMEENGKCPSMKVAADSSDYHVTVGARLSILWGDGYYYGGVITKMKNQGNKRISFVEYYDGEKAWHVLGAEQYSVIYPVGTQVYKNFPGRGSYWGEISSSENDSSGLCYQVEYSNGDLETITNEPDSALLLQELNAGILAAKQKQNKRKHHQGDSKIAATDSRKSKKTRAV